MSLFFEGRGVVASGMVLKSTNYLLDLEQLGNL